VPRGAAPFDPEAIVDALNRHHVLYIVIGGYARAIGHGADEVTLGVDICPSLREDNLRRLDAALSELGAHLPDGKEPTLSRGSELEEVIELQSERGEVKVVPRPSGTQGYEDLRRAAVNEYIADGVRAPFASNGDLSRMLAALDREADMQKLLDLRLLNELEVGRGIEI
jgi:hypothetical protein